MDLTLYIGTKNYSSWSLRPYLALKAASLHFREEKILLRKPDSKEKLCAISPTGKVPVLRHGNFLVWESLSICEYVAELAPEAKLWPQDSRIRAWARSVATEMQNGFPLVRQTMPVDIVANHWQENLMPEAADEIARIKKIWEECLTQSGGPFLFGHFTIADAMYAPVVTRFRTYGVKMTTSLSNYSDNIFALPAMQEWAKEAALEVDEYYTPAPKQGSL